MDRTYAHTCVPLSGMTVKRSWSSSSRTHATFPRDDSEAVNSVNVLVRGVLLYEGQCLLVKVLMFLIDARKRIAA